MEIGVCSWGHSLGRVRASHGYDSRIGGLPRCFGGTQNSSTSSSSSSSSSTTTTTTTSLSTLQHPLCSTCSSPLFLVAQIYAPTAGVERNLLVFGCNRGSCYDSADGVIRPGTWRVLRTQEDGVPDVSTTSPIFPSEREPVDKEQVVVDELASTLISNEESDGSSLLSNKTFVESEWGAGAAGAWGSDSGVEAVADTWSKTRDVAIEQATAMSVLAAQRREASQSAAARIASEEEVLDIAAFPNCFPAFEIETYLVEDEDEAASSSRRRRGGGGANVEDEDDSDDEGIGEDEREKQHARKLLSEYESWAGKVVTVEKYNKGHFSGEEEEEEDMGPVDDTMADDLEEETNNEGSPPPSLSLTTHRQAPVSTSTHGGAGGGGGGEAYERLPPKVRHMLRFQKVLAKAPEQVLRYEWDGEPVWPVPPKLLLPPAGERHFQAPQCICGSDRKFELQLMPHLLMGLCPEEYALDRRDATTSSATSSSNSAAASLLQGGGAGMDFLTALVYSCESSCRESQEEFIYVVPDNRSESFVKIR